MVGGNIGSITIQDFLNMDVSRFGNQETLSALGALGTRKFVKNWANPNYVHLKALKRYVDDIPNSIRAHHDDIVAGRRGFEGHMRMIGDGAYNVEGWL